MPTIEDLRRQRKQRLDAAPAPIAEIETPEANAPDDGNDLTYDSPKLNLEQPEWQAARNNPLLMNSIKRYAKNTDNQDFSDDDKAFEWFVGDRRWKDSNVMSTLKELNFVKGGFGAKYAHKEDLEDLNVIKTEWDKLPGGFERIGRGEVLGGTGAILDNLWRGIVDPSILFGGLAGKAVGSLVVKSGAKEVTKQAVKRGLQTTAAITADAAVTGGANVAYQETNIEAGVGGQTEVDEWQAMVAGTLGAVMSAPGSVMAFKPKGLDNVDPVKAAEQARRAAEDIRTKDPDANALFGGSKKTTPDGLKLSETDVELAKDMADPGRIAARDAEPSFVDLMDGGDPVNIANVTQDNINLAKSLADTVPGWNVPENFFKWWGGNAARVYKFKADHFPNIDDATDFDKMATALEREFPEVFKEERRGVVTDQQSRAEAARLTSGKTATELAEGLVNTPIGTAFNSSQTVASKMIINMLRDDIEATKKLLLTDNTPLTAQQMDDVERKWELMGMAMAKYAGIRTEAGRSLRNVDVPNSNYQRFLKAGSKAANVITGTAKSTKEREALLRDLGKAMSMLDEGDNLQLDLFVANLHQNKGSLGDKFYEMYYNWGLLSNPSTQVINFLGNTAHSVLENAERGIAAGFTPGERAPFIHRLAGYGGSLVDSVKLGFRTYLSELPSDPQTRLENMDKHAFSSWRFKEGKFEKAGVGEGGWVFGGKQARIPGRFLLGMDEFTKSLHQGAYIYEAAIREAQNQGITDKQARKEFLRKFRADVPPEVQQQALEESRRLTYTDKLGPGLRGFQQFIDDLPGGRIIIPFVRTPAKIIKQAADMLSIPGVVSTERTAADFAEGGLQRKRALARVTLGYSLLGLGAMTAYMGNATGPSPSDPGERGSFDAYALPWSARVGNNWIQFNRFDPVAIPLTVGVGLEKTFEAFAASGTGAEREDSYLATMASFMSDALLDKSFFQGVENVVGAIMEPERRAESFAKGVVRSFTPAITAGFARAVDPRTTAPLTFQEVIQDRIGFDLRKKVPTKLDDFGREVHTEVPGTYKGDEGVGATINRFINPFKARSGGDDPVAAEVYELKVKLGWDTKRYKGVELDSAQQYVLRKATGQHFYNSVRHLQSLPEWKTLPKEAKRMFLDGAKENARFVGQAMLSGTYPELVRRGIMEDKDTKRLSGPTRSEIMEYMKPGGAKKLDAGK